MSSEKCSMTVRADIPRNRLYCVITGKIGSADMEKFYTDIRFGIADLKPGFSVITDLSRCSLGHLGAIPTFRKVMNYIAGKGAREVIRVIDKKKLLFRQALNLASKMQGYMPVYVESLEEAERLLDRDIRRSQLRFKLHDTEVLVKFSETVHQTGKIIDISLTGCAFTMTGMELREGEQVSVCIPLNCESMIHEFELPAKVVRALPGGCAVMFAEAKGNDVDRFWSCLLQESHREMKKNNRSAG